MSVILFLLSLIPWGILGFYMGHIGVTGQQFLIVMALIVWIVVMEIAKILSSITHKRDHEMRHLPIQYDL